MAGWPEFARQANQARANQQATALVADNYALASQLAFWAPKGCQVIGLSPRWSTFNLQPAQRLTEALYVRPERDDDGSLPPGLQAVGPTNTISRTRNGRLAENYRLIKVRLDPQQTDGSALLPRATT